MDHQRIRTLIAVCLEVENRPITLPSSSKARPAREVAPLVTLGHNLQRSESLPKASEVKLD